MKRWTEERLGLQALGYFVVTWVHIACVQHGTFRLGIPEELDEYPCPHCQKRCKAAVVGNGITRQGVPTPAETIIKPLSIKAREYLTRPEEKVRKPRRVKDWHHGQKLRKLARTLASV